MLKSLTMKLNQQNGTGQGGGVDDVGRGGDGRGGQLGVVLCRVCQVARTPPSVFTSHSIAQCGSLSALDRRELYMALKPYGGEGCGEQQGMVLCRACQGARMPPSTYTSHNMAQCGSLSAWDRMALFTALHDEFGQVEKEEFDEGQESQPNSA